MRRSLQLCLPILAFHLSSSILVLFCLPLFVLGLVIMGMVLKSDLASILWGGDSNRGLISVTSKVAEKACQWVMMILYKFWIVWMNIVQKKLVTVIMKLVVIWLQQWHIRQWTKWWAVSSSCLWVAWCEMTNENLAPECTTVSWCPL